MNIDIEPDDFLNSIDDPSLDYLDPPVEYDEPEPLQYHEPDIYDHYNMATAEADRYKEKCVKLERKVLCLERDLSFKELNQRPLWDSD